LFITIMFGFAQSSSLAANIGSYMQRRIAGDLAIADLRFLSSW